jgi:tRNA (guanine-N7-)-methyltransferase
MPLKHPDPFACRTAALDATVNPYVARLAAGAADGSLPIAFGDALREFPGRWRDKLAAVHRRAEPWRRMIAEIGCHKGVTLLAVAAAEPDVACVGLDITYKRVVTTAERFRKKKLGNAFAAMANASAIDQLFAAGELDGCLIFFPDPWVKKASQAKHRLVDDGFAERLRTALAPGGFVWLKTDQQVYFEGARAAIDAAGLVRMPDDWWPLGRDYDSSFERRFRAQKLPIFEGKWSKPLTNADA